jgi:hypothetical protein
MKGLAQGHVLQKGSHSGVNRTQHYVNHVLTIIAPIPVISLLDHQTHSKDQGP